MKNEKKKRVVIIAVLAICFVAAGIFAGITLTSDVTAKGDMQVTEDLKKNETEAINDEEKAKVVTEDSKEAKAYDEDVKTGEKEPANAVKKSEAKKNSTTDKRTSSTNSNSSKDSNKQNSSSSNKTNTSNKKETSTKNPSKPAHSHSWSAVYKEVNNGYYKTVTKKEAYDCCNACGADITGNTAAHLKQHALAGENASFRIAYRYYDVEEWVPNVEKVVSYYKCSCGATK